MARRVRVVVAGGVALCTTLGALGQELTITGTNTLRWERYDTRGSALSSPYPISTTTGYDEFALNVGWKPSAYDQWRGFITGVVNDSPYRSPERDFVPERVTLSRENGEGAIAYRVDLGDFFAFTSYRTQQRPLKGFALELQPGVEAGSPIRQSILLFGGAFQQDWRQLRWGEDNSLGLSWLMEAAIGRLTFNLLRNEREAKFALDSTRRSQQVASLAAEVPFALGPASWRWEGELAGLRGDHDPLPGTGDGRDKRDTGAYMQLSGIDTTQVFSWRLRGERYGKDYQPFGAVVSPDRRSGEAHFGWALPASLNLRLRWQEFRDGVDSGTELDTRVVGASLSGPILATGASLNAEVFRQRSEKADATLDQKNVTANASVSMPVAGWMAQLGGVVQNTDDALRPDANPRLRQGSITITRSMALGAWQGIVSPGLVWRRVSDSANATQDLHATLALALSNGPHRLALNAGRLAQNPSVSGVPDVATVNMGLDYRYRFGRNEIGLDYTLFDRRPSPGEKTQAYRAGIQWTVYLDRVPTRAIYAAGAATPLPLAASFSRDAGLLAAISLGSDLDTVTAKLAQAGIGNGARQPRAVVYETRLLPEVEARQRLALVDDIGRIERVALLVSLADTGGASDAGHTWERVLRALVERYGRPATTLDEGAFGPNYANDVMMGRLVRSAEWILPDGVLRAGIPRRLDGVARIEVQHARALPNPRDSAWGLAEVQ